MRRTGDFGFLSRRLRHAPWIAVAVLTGFAAIVLSSYAACTLDAQRGAGIARVDSDLGEVAAAAAHQVGTSPQGAVTQAFTQWVDTGDSVTFQGQGLSRSQDDCPQFAVVFGTTTDTREFHSTKHCTRDLNEEQLQRLRTQAVRARATVYTTLDIDSSTIRAVAAPVDDWRYDRFGGAAVAWKDLGAERARENQIAGLMWGLTATLIALFGVVTYVLTVQLLPTRIRALEQQETVLACAAHDLRAPIAALRALAETARDHSDHRAELLDRTVQLSRRMGDIVDDLLSRARLTAGIEEIEFQPLRLDQLVTDIIEEIGTDTATITSTTAPTVVNGDPTLLARAIRNLIDNAIRHGHRPSQPARVHVTVAGGRITVADEGPGIDSADVDAIFEAFQSNGGSTGLGLPIARWVAHAHSGTLDVHSTEGGAIFEMALPTPVRDR